MIIKLKGPRPKGMKKFKMVVPEAPQPGSDEELSESQKRKQEKKNQKAEAARLAAEAEQKRLEEEAKRAKE